ncbi:coiled-coil domain-containing protein 86-like [Dunckerocampus dactyliophorus]|uniref:coiled-coil domain-containing protein 86-like n=1 Tax=Dunckerocampus dactyliophorus TaxID=161453 RepID=UPI0024060AE6|nr:coiled-coil domain-containing protein 86-like [Dunckerocampus dactyliophorus]
MSKKQSAVSDDTHKSLAEENRDEPPVSRRTRSGRAVRAPVTLLSSETPVRSSSRRTRRSVIPEQTEPVCLEPTPVEPVETEPIEVCVEPTPVELVESKPIEVCVEPTPVEPIEAKPIEVCVEPTPVEPIESKPIEVCVEPTPVEPVEAKPIEVCVEPTPVEPVESKPIEVCVEPTPVEPVESKPIDVCVEHAPAEQCTEAATDGQVSKPSPAERAPATAESTPRKKPRLGPSVKPNAVVIPLGKPKSGRVWKDRNKQRFSALVRDTALCTSWEKKMAAKREKQLVQQYSLQLKEQKAKQKEEKRKRREENLKRREENERKAEIVQVIRNTAKIKRMKKKQLRKIEKRDTLALMEKTRDKQNVNSKQAKKNKTKNLT